MAMDLGFFEKILSIDSTSGKERALSEMLAAELPDIFSVRPLLQRQQVGDGTENLLFIWGEPDEFSEDRGVIFCTHMDTVPPYIAPSIEGATVRGRGSCDAKGQIFAMVRACEELCRQGHTGFGLLLLSGEETGSWGAKAFARLPFRAKHLIVGEPTSNKLVTASKGTKLFEVEILGKEAHSGYPGLGASAVDAFVSFASRLKAAQFPQDEFLESTTYNIGRLASDNPQNILSGRLTCKIYFRTTFASDALVSEWMMRQRGAEGYGCEIRITSCGGDSPLHYTAPEGFSAAPVAFGSDAPHLGNFTCKSIVGPGTIAVAHRDEEYVELSQIDAAVALYQRLFLRFTQGV